MFRDLAPLPAQNARHPDKGQVGQASERASCLLSSWLAGKLGSPNCKLRSSAAAALIGMGCIKLARAALCTLARRAHQLATCKQVCVSWLLLPLLLLVRHWPSYPLFAQGISKSLWAALGTGSGAQLATLAWRSFIDWPASRPAARSSWTQFSGRALCTFGPAFGVLDLVGVVVVVVVVVVVAAHKHWATAVIPRASVGVCSFAMQFAAARLFQVALVTKRRQAGGGKGRKLCVNRNFCAREKLFA